jgi:hypothetical protein
MTRILISTTCRHATPNEPSGFLYVYNVEKRETQKKCEIIEPPHRDADPNPRGGFRGLKGLSIRNDKIALANASTVFIYDKNWDLVSHFWHPSCAGIHDIKLMDDYIWVTSSSNDLVFCFSFDGEIIRYYDIRKFFLNTRISNGHIRPFLSEDQVHRGLIDFRNPRSHDNNFTDLMHINSLDFLSNGDMMISCGLLRLDKRKYLHKINHVIRRINFLGFPYYFYVIYEKYLKSLFGRSNSDHLNLTSSSILISIDHKGIASLCLKISGVKVPSHSLKILDERSAVYLNSTTNELINFNPKSGKVNYTKRIGHKFLRGIEELPDECLIVGDNNRIIKYDFVNRSIVYDELLSNNTIEAVYDIVLLPNCFSNPPDSFITHHSKSINIKQI